MSEKVKVPKEVASALDDLLWLNTDNDVMKIYFDAINVNEARQIPESALVIRNLEPMQLAVILLNGYEIEETPEEKVFKYYQEAVKDTGNISIVTRNSGHDRKDAVEFVLGTLGVKIEGINK